MALEHKVVSKAVQIDVVIVEGEKNYLGRRTLARYEDGVLQSTMDGFMNKEDTEF